MPVKSGPEKVRQQNVKTTCDPEHEYEQVKNNYEPLVSFRMDVLQQSPV